VTDLDEMVARLCGLGATLDREIQIREYGRMANMADPFGNGFDLIEFSGPGYDNSAEGWDRYSNWFPNSGIRSGRE
jgi:hypothetical protein